MESPRVLDEREPVRCPYCREALGEAAGQRTCPACAAAQHRECAAQHGGCVSCGAALEGIAGRLHPSAAPVGGGLAKGRGPGPRGGSASRTGDDSPGAAAGRADRRARGWLPAGPTPAGLAVSVVRGEVLVRWEAGEFRPRGLLVLGLVTCLWPLVWLLVRPALLVRFVVGPERLSLTLRGPLGIPTATALGRGELRGAQVEGGRLWLATAGGDRALHAGWGAGLDERCLEWLTGLIEAWRVDPSSPPPSG